MVPSDLSRTVVEGIILKAATDEDRHPKQSDCRDEDNLQWDSAEVSTRRPDVETDKGRSKDNQRDLHSDERKQQIGSNKGTQYAAGDIPSVRAASIRGPPTRILVNELWRHVAGAAQSGTMLAKVNVELCCSLGST